MLFLSLLPQFVPAGAAPLTWSLLLSLIVVGCALLWFPLIAVVVHSAGTRFGESRSRYVLAQYRSGVCENSRNDGAAGPWACHPDKGGAGSTSVRTPASSRTRQKREQ